MVKTTFLVIGDVVVHINTYRSCQEIHAKQSGQTHGASKTHGQCSEDRKTVVDDTSNCSTRQGKSL